MRRKTPMEESIRTTPDKTEAGALVVRRSERSEPPQASRAGTAIVNRRVVIVIGAIIQWTIGSIWLYVTKR